MPDAPPEPSPAQRTLAYSSGGGRTRWRVRVVISLLIASNLYFIHDKWRPDLRVRMLWHQRRALTFEWPEGQVLFEGDPARAAALIGQRGYVAVTSPGLKPGESLAVSRAATERYNDLETIQEILPRKSSGGGLFGNASGSSGAPAPPVPQTQDLVVFLHELTSPAGNRRLVVVRTNIDLPEQHVSFEPVVFVPSSYGEAMDETGGGSMSTGGFWRAGHDAPSLAPSLWEDRPALRVFAGRHDPQDRSRFTVEFETFYGRSVIEGRLDDQDNVTMKVILGVEAEGPDLPGTDPRADDGDDNVTFEDEDADTDEGDDAEEAVD